MKCNRADVPLVQMLIDFQNIGIRAGRSLERLMQRREPFAGDLDDGSMNFSNLADYGGVCIFHRESDGDKEQPCDSSCRSAGLDT